MRQTAEASWVRSEKEPTQMSVLTDLSSSTLSLWCTPTRDHMESISTSSVLLGFICSMTIKILGLV